MNIRTYRPEDHNGVVTLFKMNTPQFFDESEIEDLKQYLKNEIEDYFVVEEKHKIIGAGGINYFPNDRKARIAWDAIRPNLQGQGIGKKLTQHRLNHIKNQSNIDKIIVRTTQLAYKFYQKMGFELVIVKKDFWAEGYDLYHMEQENKVG